MDNSKIKSALCALHKKESPPFDTVERWGFCIAALVQAITGYVGEKRKMMKKSISFDTIKAGFAWCILPVEPVVIDHA